MVVLAVSYASVVSDALAVADAVVAVVDVAEAADAAVDVADLIFTEKSLREFLQGLFFL